MGLDGRKIKPVGLIVSGTVVALGLTSGFSVAAATTAKGGKGASHKAGPTAESALAAEQEIAKAMRNNDSDGIEHMLADDWAVITTAGEIGEGKSIFPSGIKSGYLTRKTFELSESRVRLYGNVALITSKVNLSGVIGGRPFDVAERQTDVLHWDHGGWKSVLTHESKIASK